MESAVLISQRRQYLVSRDPHQSLATVRGIGVQEVSSRPLRGRQSAENDAPPCSCPSFHPVETD